jgi:nucleoside diphosphate kinase
VDAIVALLNTDSRPAAVTRAEIAEVIQQVDNTVTQFVALLIKEEAKQEAQADDQKKKDAAKDKEAAVTDTQCKPGA